VTCHEAAVMVEILEQPEAIEERVGKPSPDALKGVF
jgi:hypothetical protein